jgi:hypothetical protein
VRATGPERLPSRAAADPADMTIDLLRLGAGFVTLVLAIVLATGT